MINASLTRSVAILAVGGALFAAGCSTSSTSSPGAPSGGSKSKSTAASGIPCDQVKKLKTSLTDLTKTGFNSGSASKLTSELKNIQNELTAIKGQSSGKFADQVSKLNTTITKISTDAKGLNSNPAGTISKLITDLNKLRTTAQPVITEINAACPK